MPDLLRKPFGTRGKVHQITPQSAGWRYVGFSLYRMKAGDTATEETGETEVILVVVVVVVAVLDGVAWQTSSGAASWQTAHASTTVPHDDTVQHLQQHDLASAGVRSQVY